MASFGQSAVWHRAVTIRARHGRCRSLSCRWEGFAVNARRRKRREADPDRALGGVFTGLGRHTADVFCGASVPLARLRLITAFTSSRGTPQPAVNRGDLSRRRPGMGRGRQDQALRRRLTRPWAAHRSARPGQAERPPAAGNPPPFPGLRAPLGSTGRLLQLAEPPHPRRVTPPGGRQRRIRDDRAVRSPDSSREILRAIGADQRLRASEPCRTARLPRHVPDLPAGELPLKLAPALTVPHGLSSIHAQQHAHPPAMSTRR